MADVTLPFPVHTAASAGRRMRGWLGADGPYDGDGRLWLTPCRSVHTVGMRFTIDVAFVRTDGGVVRTIAGLRPWRVTAPVPGAAGVLELPAGTLDAQRLVRGDRVAWRAA
jgi:uncharacterized membrane protein (UPF0127 family)